MPDLRNIRAEDVAYACPTVDIVVQGDSGTGKSRLGALMPDPLVILLEKHGLKTILSWNPDAFVWRVYEDDTEGTYTGRPVKADEVPTQIRDASVKLAMVEHMLQAVEASRPHPEGGRLVPSWRMVKGELAGFDFEKAIHVRSVVLDTGTEWHELKFEALGGKGRKGADVPDGLWNQLKDATVDMHRRMRDLPLHTMVLCHVNEREIQGGLKSILGYYGRTAPPIVPRLVDALGWLVKRSTEEGVGYACVFEGASDVAITKWAAGLRAVEHVPRDPKDGGPAQWIAAIAANDSAKQLGLAEKKLTLSEALEPTKAAIEQREREEAEKAERERKKRDRDAGKVDGGRRAAEPGQAPVQQKFAPPPAPPAQAAAGRRAR